MIVIHLHLYYKALFKLARQSVCPQGTNNFLCFSQGANISHTQLGGGRDKHYFWVVVAMINDGDDKDEMDVTEENILEILGVHRARKL